MAYLVTVGFDILGQIPNLAWEVVKAYLQLDRSSLKKRTQGENVFLKYSEDVEILKEGAFIGLNSRRIDKLKDPPWLDVELVKKGQEFARSYYFSISYTNLISLFLLFSHDRSLRPLIYTRRSGEVETAYRRYMSTVHRVRSWYEDDLIDSKSSARGHIRRVNGYHLGISSKLNCLTEEEFLEKSVLDREVMLSECQAGRVRRVVRESGVVEDRSLAEVMDGGLHVSQSHMAVTQFGFMGLAVLYPDKFGISLEGLESFVHLWLYIGYLLGIEDRYNLCSGPLDRVRLRCSAVLECVLKPCLLQVGPSWEHMSLCVCRGINRSLKRLLFEPSLALLLDTINLDSTYFHSTMRLHSKFRLYLTKFVFRYVVTKPTARERLNKSVIILLDNDKQFS